jgi:hypothetical protein
MYVGVFQLNKFANHPRNSPRTGVNNGVIGVDVGDVVIIVGRGKRTGVVGLRSSAAAEIVLSKRVTK